MEQTSSSAYPNVLVLEYLRSTGRSGPNQQTMKKAGELVGQGYQQLVRFQKQSGGFNWWGDNQAENVVLTALGLQEFFHMSRVRDVDPKILEGAKRYLAATQRPDGSWKATQELHGYNMSLGRSDLVSTAYVAWSLAEAGEKGPMVDRALAWIEKNLGKGSEDPYTLALVANALALRDPQGKFTQKVLRQLAAARKTEAGKGSYLPASAQTVTFSSGPDAVIETTALAAAAFLQAKSDLSLASELVRYLLAARKANGAFGSTQATILSLRALLLAAGGAPQEGTVAVDVTLNGQPAGAFRITPDDSDVTRVLDLAHLTRTGKNSLAVRVQGKSAALLQASARHFLPWPEKLQAPPGLALDVRYERTQAKVGERLEASAEIAYGGKLPTFMVVAELGVPPGMDVDGTTLDAMVGRGELARWSKQGDRLVVFLNEVKPGARTTVRWGLVPRMELKAQAPESAVYEYYTPSNRAAARPVLLEVG